MRNTRRTTLDAFFVKTEKILFIAMVNRKPNCRGKGFISFTGGEALYFNIDGEDHGQILGKCRSVAQRIARIYNGSLEQGVVDRDGVFHSRSSDVSAEQGGVHQGSRILDH